MRKIIVLLLWSLVSVGQEVAQPQEFIYKKIDTTQLKLTIYQPQNRSKASPAIVFFFGGGWVSGSIGQFKTQAEYLAQRGMVAILADYRVTKRNQSTPFESLKDAKSAMRFVRKNANLLGIDPQHIAGAGGSAGGHLAAACFTNESINETTDDLSVSAKPNALVLFNPVIDNGPDGYGYERVGERYTEFSPMHNLKKGFPPTIFFLGTADKLIPVATGQKFKQQIEILGGRCDLHLFDNQPHGFFNQSPFKEETLQKADDFLRSLGYL
ncbi:MAG: alpha/beta hydrolase [Spirosomataceae bacterium]